MFILNIGASTLAANGAATVTPHLTLHVRSQVPMVIDEFRRASMDVLRILGAIHVQADLLLDVPHSRRPPQRRAGGTVIDLLVETRASVLGFSTNEALLGETRPGQHGSDAEIVLFLDQIGKAARAYQKTVPTVLALVIAHEIGHALLPAPAHSKAGIMQAPWVQRTMDQAADYGYFTAQQGELIRQRLTGCCQVDSSRDRRAEERGPN